MKLYFIRHGESIANCKGIYQGHLDTDLSDLGRVQARKLGERFKGEKIDFIYSSDLKRAYDTAKEILKFHPNLKIKIDELLRERSHGILTGKERCDFYNSEEMGIINLKAEGGENFYDHKKRGEFFLSKILEEHSDMDTLAIVCHGGTIKVIMSILFDIEPHIAYSKQLNTPNTCVFLVEINGNEKKLILNGCIKHLENI